LDDVCCYKNHAEPVKSKLPNEIGLYDMVGKVLEWGLDEIDDVREQGFFFNLILHRIAQKQQGHLLKGGSCMNGKYTNNIEMV